jgi:hypothetical protein
VLCGIIPTPASAAGDPGGPPSTEIVPPSGGTRPAQQRIRVVLPAPFGPSSAVSRPARADRDTPSSTVRPPNRTVSPSIDSAGLGTRPILSPAYVG